MTKKKPFEPEKYAMRRYRQGEDVSEEELERLADGLMMGLSFPEDHRQAAKATMDALCDDVTKLGHKPITQKLSDYIKKTKKTEERDD